MGLEDSPQCQSADVPGACPAAGAALAAAAAHRAVARQRQQQRVPRARRRGPRLPGFHVHRRRRELHQRAILQQHLERRRRWVRGVHAWRLSSQCPCRHRQPCAATCREFARPERDALSCLCCGDAVTCTLHPHELVPVGACLGTSRASTPHGRAGPTPSPRTSMRGGSRLAPDWVDSTTAGVASPSPVRDDGNGANGGVKAAKAAKKKLTNGISSVSAAALHLGGGLKRRTHKPHRRSCL